MANVGVLGAGSWGTALSVLLHDNGHEVTIWSIDQKEVEMLNTKREHESKLPGVKLPETMTTLYFVGMTALSLVFYIPVNKLTPKLGKKKMILFAFAVFSLAYFYTGFMGKMSFIPETVQGLILTVVAALPMAIFGILPQAVVADIAQSDSITSGSNREGMFYAARTFAFKLGQSLSMLIFTAVSTIGTGDGTGYRIAAFGAAVFCMVGGIILVFYNEKKINGIIGG